MVETIVTYRFYIECCQKARYTCGVYLYSRVTFSYIQARGRNIDSILGITFKFASGRAWKKTIYKIHLGCFLSLLILRERVSL